MTNIVTYFVHPPIPNRHFDWCAHDDNYEPPDSDGVGGGPIGWGRTEAEAVAEYYAAVGEDADPCTVDARNAGCTCSMQSVNSASIDPPEPIVDRDCPLHGYAPDPDDERDWRIEDENNFHDQKGWDGE